MTTRALEDLLTLQGIDTAIDQVRHRRATLPQRAQLVALAADVKSLDLSAAQLLVRRDEAVGRLRTAEEDLAGTERRVKEVERRLYGGAVSASRELSAMAADIEQLQARASQLEELALERMDEAEPLEQGLAEMVARRAAMGVTRQELLAALSAAETELDGSLADLTAKREAAASAVPEGLVATYESLRRRLGGVGVARLVGAQCSGCHLAVPAVELDRVRHHPEDMAFCDQCGRILVL
jgi:predicted  nucleic acid-binding Zn-ribbon protein